MFCLVIDEDYGFGGNKDFSSPFRNMRRLVLNNGSLIGFCGKAIC